MASDSSPGLRLSNMEDIGILEDGRERIVPIRELRRGLEVDALIRLHRQDFDLFDPERGSLVHFNLESTLNEVGKHYAIVPIIKAGRRRPDGSEILPVIDASVARRAVCTEVIQHLPLHQVTAAQFAGSLPNIRTAEELGMALLRRYRPMFPDQSAADLLARGCALTRLAILKEGTARPDAVVSASFRT